MTAIIVVRSSFEVEVARWIALIIDREMKQPYNLKQIF